MAVDPAFPLAEHVCRTQFSDLPAATVTATKRDILDTFGCMLGGSAAPGIDALCTLLDEWGGREEARVLLRNRRLPAPQAALLNASMGHALDFDDTMDHGGSIHPGVSVLGASLAMADRLGAVSGRDFVAAVALGLDVSCRIALASTLDRGWHRTAAIGIFGATAAAGKLLGLNAGQMRHALGIAYSHAAGNRQCIVDGALTKRLQAGQAASGGVFAALLAQRDFSGAHNIFSGRFGFFELYQPNGADPSRLLADLGSAFRGDELSFKPYPCGRPLHAAIDAALAVRAELGVTEPGQIATVTIAADPANHADQFGSGPHKSRPTQVVEAQFAEPFLVAAALAHGRLGIAEVSGFDDPSVLALAARIHGEARLERSKGWLEITVQHVDGRIAAVTASDPLGSPHKPLSEAQFAAKFRDCAGNAGRPIEPERVDAALRTLGGLELAPDVTELLGLFA